MEAAVTNWILHFISAVRENSDDSRQRDEITSYTFHATNLDDVYFKGSKEQWDAITIDYDGQPCLKTATIHYNS